MDQSLPSLSRSTVGSCLYHVYTAAPILRKGEDVDFATLETGILEFACQLPRPDHVRVNGVRALVGFKKRVKSWLLQIQGKHLKKDWTLSFSALHDPHFLRLVSASSHQHLGNFSRSAARHPALSTETPVNRLPFYPPL